MDPNAENYFLITTDHGQYHVMVDDIGEGRIESAGPIMVNRIPHRVDARWAVRDNYRVVDDEEVTYQVISVSGWHWGIRTDQSHPPHGLYVDATDNARRKIIESLQSPLLTLVEETKDSGVANRASLRSIIRSLEYSEQETKSSIARKQNELAKVEESIVKYRNELISLS